MVDKKSDYTQKNFNLNDFLPSQNKGEFLESLNTNLFNRYLTKDEFDRIVGLIGDPDPNEKVSTQIKEPTPFRQDNQLQPVVSQKIGTENHFMAFEDFMTRIARTGVDTEKFDQWGEAMQFNWVPPIDMDKIVNYRDYYWNSNVIGATDTPQYITIKSQKNWTNARYNQAIKSILEMVPTVSVVKHDDDRRLISVSGNNSANYPVGSHIILVEPNGINTPLTVNSVSYNIASANTDIFVEEEFTLTEDQNLVYIASIDLPVLSVRDGITRLRGDLTNLFVDGYIVSLNTPVTQAVKVASSTFDAVTNVTSVTLVGAVGAYTTVSTYPLISMMHAEMEVSADKYAALYREEWSNNHIGDVLWFNNYSIVSGRYGTTVLNSPVFTDNNIDFAAYGVRAGDNVVIESTYKNEGSYNAISVSGSSITTGATFFSSHDLHYRVVRPFSLELITSVSAPSNPTQYDLWYRNTTDVLSQWTGSEWKAVYRGVSLLVNTINNRAVSSYTNENDWSSTNNWVHRSQITEYAGMIRAQMPIIEYFPFLELSTTSYSEKIWRYRKTAGISYVDSSVHPKMIELMDFTYTGDEYEFTDAYTIVFDSRYGNFGNELNVGDDIKLVRFIQNDGVYKIAGIDYSRPTDGGRFVTTLKLANPLISLTDMPFGATIQPVKTSTGDNFLGLEAKQWEYGGVSKIEASSLEPTKNPMLAINVNSYISGNFETIVGLTSQEYSLVSGEPEFEAALIFDPSLQNIVLIDDYQEGDIRVYVNGKRTYGVFEDIQSEINPDYVAGIRFVNYFYINPNDTIRVELGAYAEGEIGLGSVVVNTPTGNELANLVNIRRIEQTKSENNQYPFFTLRDIYGKRLPFATSIFKYKESETSAVNATLLKRIVTDSTDYSFVQELSDPESGRLYCYYDYQNVGDELQTIWKRGTYNEMYRPVKIDGEWEMPNQWYYNIDHKNYNEVNLTQIYRHFKSIIDVQEQPGMFSTTGNLFFLDDEINYGIGGTIKEHNESFDTLVSSIFVNNGNPVRVIDFAKAQYDSQIRYVKDRFYQSAATLFDNDDVVSIEELRADVISEIIGLVENNGKYDQWFGDSTSYNSTTNVGLRNWIASLPQFGITKATKPSLIADSTLGLYVVTGHDGRQIDVAFSPALRQQLLTRVTKNTATIKQIVTSDNEVFPTTYLNKPIYNGLLLQRTNRTTNTISLFRATPTLTWERMDINAIFADTILAIENRLYDIAIEINHESVYDFDALKNKSGFESLMEAQFNAYASSEHIDQPLSNADRFRQNNPFTWNYAYTPIKVDPITGGMNYNVSGSWQALYKSVFGTSYPHLEPWVLQGYASEPSWWEATYRDDSNARRWTRTMWSNIFTGVVPANFATPSGSISDGSEDTIVRRFTYLPVNTSTTVTSDGYALDALLPPYWNSANTTNARVRGLYDPNSSEFVTTPSADFTFGQDGAVEWEWKISGAYLYDLLIVAYKLDPMNVIHSTIGMDYELVSCLQISKETEKVYSHRDITFHGDFIDSLNNIYKSFGINQWYVHYNRYAGYDGIASEFRSLWKDWTPDLSYLVGAFIDTSSFDIHNDYFDITTKDYEIAIKKTKGIADKWLQSLEATVTSVPSQYSKLRDQGIGWTASFNNVSPIPRQMEYYGVQNYSVNMNTGDNTIRTFSYPLTGIEYTPSSSLVKVIYSTPLSLSSKTAMTVDEEYDVSITFNGTDTVSAILFGVETVEEFLYSLNFEIKDFGRAVIDNGTIAVYSNNGTSSSSVEIVDNDAFAAIAALNTTLPSTIVNNEFKKCFRIAGNFINVFESQTNVVVLNDTIFNGTYTIDHLFYDQNEMETLIFVKENVTIPAQGNIAVTGQIEPANAITLPEDWTTGTVIYFNTTGYLPGNIDDEMPYFVIRLDDRTFKIAETAEAAAIGVALNINGVALGEAYAGRLEMTFTALGGVKTDYVWRTHVLDTRQVLTANNLSISGIQLMIDFLTGYAGYTYGEGFRFRNENADNIDVTTGMQNNWHTEIEKFVNWMYALRNYNQESMQSYSVASTGFDDSISMLDGNIPNWQNGTAVIVLAEGSNPLPAAFDTPFTASIPYYVVRKLNDDTAFKLAVTKADAIRGNTIDIGPSSGSFRVQMYKEIAQFPSHELNPFKHHAWINHEQGVLGNVLDEDYTDPTSASRLYDNTLIEMPVSDVLVFRQDKESHIALTEDIRSANDTRVINGGVSRHIAGMHLFFDGYEHIIHFQDYSVSDSLIYDSFFGLATPRFYVEFDRQKDFTLRPNVGGFVIQGDGLVQNLESITNDMRHFYDSSIAAEGRLATDLARKSMGYDGSKDYMNNLKINAKTQFQFWQGMIQSKGSIRAVDAFVNQTRFESAVVDEFWAYKVAEFGDNNERNYLEMKMIPEDAVRNELRLEFVAPENVAPDLTFNSIHLTDMARWWNQPDQLQAMAPNQSFFFNAKVIGTVDDMAQRLVEIDNRLLYISTTIMPNVIITYFDRIAGLVKTMIRDIDYKVINSYIIQFVTDPRPLFNVSLSVLTYDYESHNPAKVIDKQSGVVTTDLPIWHPAFGQYYTPAYAVVDLHRPTDPAIYNNSIDGSNTGTALWKSNHEGQVWFDSSSEQYIPYYDQNVFKNLNDRISMWGKLAPWGKIKLYQWTASDLTPEEYDEQSAKDSKNLRISNDSKVTGTVYKRLYENMNYDDPDNAEAQPYWIEAKETNVSFIAGLYETVQTQLQGKTVNLYVNGSFIEQLTFENAGAVKAYFEDMYFGNHINAIIPAPVPTVEEIRLEKYKWYTPFTIEKRFDSKSGNIVNKYYYWVTEKKNEISVGSSVTTIYSSQKMLNDMSAPYMICAGFRTPDFGYGLIFGNIFDEYGYDLPYRYTQAIVRGLQGTVKQEDRYVIRFTRDFTLRDTLDRSSMTPKNRHEEWKLFREQQFEKIDLYLWTKMVEALIGYKINSTGILFNQAIPSLNRILYDRLYNAETQFGLGPQQVFTDKSLSLRTLMQFLTDPNRAFEFVNIAEFLDNNDFNTPEGIVAALTSIYQGFSVSEVNSLFFSILHDAISLKKEYGDFLKTSWVGLQISENVQESVNVPYDELRLVEGPGCDPVIPSPTPTPSSTSAPMSPTPTPTPSVTPDICGYAADDRITEDGQGRITEEGQCVRVEPDAAFPTPTPTPTPSATPVNPDVPVPPGLGAWRYMEVALNNTEDFSAINYDDSQWPEGNAPFGNLTKNPNIGLDANAFYSEFSPTIQTQTALDNTVWLRRTMNIPEVNPNGYVLIGFFDNAFKLYINGVQVLTSSSVNHASVLQQLPSNIFTVGVNTIALRCDDDATSSDIDGSYFDFTIKTNDSMSANRIQKRNVINNELFGFGSNGFYYDFSDTSSTYKNYAGTQNANWDDSVQYVQSISNDSNFARQSSLSISPVLKHDLTAGRNYLQFRQQMLAGELANFSAFSGNSSKTILVKAKEYAPSSSAPAFFYLGDTSTAKGFGIGNNNSTYNVFQFGGSGYDLSSSPVRRNEVYVYTGVKNGSELSLYLDGAKLADTNGTGLPASLTNPAYNIGQFFFDIINADIYSLIIIDRALTPEEIQLAVENM